MITFSNIGKKGNLGNQFFQIASTIGLAIENNMTYGFLPWQYQSYFKNKLPSLAELPEEMTMLHEKQFHHYTWNFKSKNSDYDLVGWLQSERYFNIQKTRYYFEFEDHLIRKIKTQYAEVFQKKTILISIRRGDFVDHPDYLQLSIKFYLNALVRFFPDWQSYNLVVLSDDIKYCKFHFSFLDNAYFGDGLNAIEQLCLGSLCDDFIISNSTFSWWTAWLGEKEDSKIIRPHQNFDGSKRRECDDKDYFPERWISYNVLKESIKLDDVAFSLDLKKNDEIISAYLSHFFDTVAIKDSKYTYYFKKDYILPPLLIYQSVLKKKEASEAIIANPAVKVFKVSKRLNYEEFLRQKDFGMFSSIFSFKRAVSKSNHDIYIMNNPSSVNAETLILKANVGQFTKIGYQFSLKRCIKKLEILLKQNVKKMLLIKK